MASGPPITVHFVNTHFAYAVPDALSNAQQTIDWMEKVVTTDVRAFFIALESRHLRKKGLYLIAGDLNVTPGTSNNCDI